MTTPQQAANDANKDMREDADQFQRSEFAEMMDRIERGDALALKRNREFKYLQKMIAQATDREISDELQRQLDELTSQEPTSEEVDAEYALRPYQHTTTFEQDDLTATWHIEYADPYSDAWNADTMNEYMRHVLHEMIGTIKTAIDPHAHERQGETKWGAYGGFYTGDGYIWTGRFQGGIIVNLDDKEDEGFLTIQIERGDRTFAWFQTAILTIASILTKYKLNVEITTDEQNNG